MMFWLVTWFPLLLVWTTDLLLVSTALSERLARFLGGWTCSSEAFSLLGSSGLDYWEPWSLTLALLFTSLFLYTDIGAAAY